MLLTLSCLFYTLFLFDTLGDAVGFEGALWVLIVVPLLPLCMFLCYTMCAKFGAFEVRRSVADDSSAAVELGVIVNLNCPADVEMFNAMHSSVSDA
jgi:hypothetical protein